MWKVLKPTGRFIFPITTKISDVFSKEKATQLPPHRPWDCAIDLLPNIQPPKSKVYPLSRNVSQAMEEYVDEALNSGFIRPSTSPAAAGFFFVEKKDGSLRPCIDYRRLNNITIKFRYPLPLVPSALEQLREAKIYTKLDLRSAYNLVRIKEGDEWKTAFLTTRGHYEYQVMPYELANSPVIFQSFINEIFRDLLNKFVDAYIDDILIFSKTEQEHISHVRTVLSRLLENQLYVKVEKCEFHVNQTSFLGYHISSQGVKMNNLKVHPDSNRLPGGSALKSAAPLYSQTLFGHSPRICPASGPRTVISRTHCADSPSECVFFFFSFFLPVPSQSEKSSSEWRSCSRTG